MLSIDQRGFSTLKEFQEKAYIPNRPSIQTNTQEDKRTALLNKTGPLAIAGRIGGSTVDFVVKGISDSMEPLHVKIKLDHDDKYQALKTLFEIFAFIATQAKALGQKVLPIDLGIAGFETSKHQSLFNINGKALPQKAGLHIMANYHFKKPLINSNHPKQHSLINFISEAKQYFSNAGLAATQLQYQDEANSINIDLGAKASQNPFQIKFKIINDTVAIGNSQVGKIGDGENILTMVCGSGFNLGELKKYDTEKAKFESLVNTEIGHNLNALNPEITDSFDPKFITDNEGKLDPEWLYAGGPVGAQEAQGLEAYMNFFKDKQDPGFQASSLAKLKKLESIAIVAAAKDEDSFALTRLKEYAESLGKFLNHNFNGLITQASTKNFVITGSHILDILSLDSVRKEFEEKLNQGRDAGNLELVELNKDKVDGMLDLVKARAEDLKAKAAVARAAAL